jgi:hypothetical protein
MLIRATTFAAVLASVLLMPISAQEKSVRPGVNDTFRDPDPRAFTERFEIESREVFAKRKEILEAIKLKPNDVVADVGARTGLFTRLFASNLGSDGRVIVIDFKRIEGESSNWTMDHVRAGQEVFEAEIVQAGFQKADEIKDLLKENDMVVFERAVQKQGSVEDSASAGRGRGRRMGLSRSTRNWSKYDDHP